MATHLFSVRRALVGTVLSVAFNLSAACHDSKTPATAVTPSQSLSVAGGNTQTGTVATSLQSPFIVRLTAGDGSGVGGVTVTWAVTAGGGALSGTTVQTDDQGYASVLLTLGTTTGANTVTASTPDGESLAFNASAVAGSVASLVKVQGDQQTLADGSVSAPLVVRAVDLYGNPVAGVTIVWSADNGTPLAPTAVTDANGLAQDLLQAAPTDGTYDVAADVPGVPPVTFTEMSVALPSSPVRGGN